MAPLRGGGALRRAGWAVVAVDDVGNLKAPACGAVPCDVLPGTDFERWRGLRCCHGRHHYHGPAHAAHRLCRYHRDGQRAKVQSFGCSGPPSTRLEQASGFPRRGHTVKVKGHATLRDAESLLFGSPRQLLLVLPWPSKRRGGRQRPTFSRFAQIQGLGRHQGCSDKTTGTAAASGAQAQAEGDCCPSYRSGIRQGFLPSFLHASRKTVISTHARSEGAACSWDEFSTLGVELLTTHHLQRQMWGSALGAGGRAVPAAAAANTLVVGHRSCAN